MSEDVDTHIIERYDLHKRLGKGAYGIVWKAVDRRVRETVALKKIFDAFRNQTDAQRTFREIMFLQEFGRHPNIIKLYNVLKADNNSLGCILAEMLLGHALFPGTSTINQIERIMNTISRPSKLDIESIGSQYASSVLEKMPRRPQKPLELYLTNSDHQAIDLVQRLLIFAPHKRLNVDQCLVHPYVLQFHSPIDEPALNYDILLPLPDHIQLSIDDYRNKLYEMIQENRTYVKRIQHNRVINNNSNQKFKSHNTTTTTMATTTTTTTTMTTTTTTMTATPLMKTNGQTIATNGRLSSVIRRSSSNNAIRTMKQQSVMEPKAPIAQAECSDTDYDTARSINRPVSIDKPKNIDTTMIENRQSRERAQSVETPQNGTVFRERTASSSSKVRPRRRSQHRTGIFSSFRKSTQHFAS
ncbi:unnamed protein product [Brugia pahangi]|uniref:Protein kinase domain-containing protein n=1 Tax=Brugia pahangi TaxID=6280 RepID=A0A0N4TVM7_BRUPA|nr:unnamed protein product [Brugia pahangi]